MIDLVWAVDAVAENRVKWGVNYYFAPPQALKSRFITTQRRLHAD